MITYSIQKEVLKTEELLTISEVAKILKVNKNAVYNLINSGKIPVLKIGSYKIRKTTLEHFIEQSEERL